MQPAFLPSLPIALTGPWLMVILVVVVIIALVFITVFARYFRLWIQSYMTGSGIDLFDLIRMTFRKVNPTVIVRSKIMAVQAGLTGRRGTDHQELGSPLHGGRVMSRW